jgi:hypothetical protein
MKEDKKEFIAASKNQLLKARFSLVDVNDIAKCVKKEFPLFKKETKKQAALAVTLYLALCSEHTKDISSQYSKSELAAHCNLSRRELVYYYLKKHNQYIESNNERYMLKFLSALYNLVIIENNKTI